MKAFKQLKQFQHHRNQIAVEHGRKKWALLPVEILKSPAFQAYIEKHKASPSNVGMYMELADGGIDAVKESLSILFVVKDLTTSWQEGHEKTKTTYGNHHFQAEELAGLTAIEMYVDSKYFNHLDKFMKKVKADHNICLFSK